MANRNGAGDRHDQNDGDGDGGSGADKPPKLSHIIEQHIDVGVSRQDTYDQWMRFQDHAAMFKKESAERRGDGKVRLTSKIGPSKRTWDAKIVEQVPGRRVAWKSTSGPTNKGIVTFHRLAENLTRVMVEMEHQPSGFMETIGTFFRMPRRRVRKDLKLFKNFVELRGEAPPSGADDRIGERGDVVADDNDTDDSDAGRERAGAGAQEGRS